MRILLLLFCFFGLNLKAQILSAPKVFFTNQKSGEERAFPMNRNGMICLKETPKNKSKFPESLDVDGKLYTLRLTQQSGTILVFNDSIYLPIESIDYLVLKEGRNVARFTFGVLSIAGMGVALAMEPSVGFFAMATFPLSYLYFAKVSRNKMYTSTWKLEVQHSPELLFPQKETLNYSWWPDMFERYLNK
jgi:hypothetical protein